MKTDTPCCRENGFAPRWLLCCLVVVLLVITWGLLLSGRPKSKAQRIVVLATWPSNGEQLVTFRLQPPNSIVTCTEVVSVSDDGSTQPPTFRVGDTLIPVSFKDATNFPRYDALPFRGSIGGRPVAYTPGRYTVAYTPTASANRLRAGVALERSGPDDWFRRFRACLERKSFSMLFLKTHHDSVFIVSEPITNVISIAR